MEETRKAYPMGDVVIYDRYPSPLAGKTVVITGKLILKRYGFDGFFNAKGYS